MGVGVCICSGGGRVERRAQRCGAFSFRSNPLAGSFSGVPSQKPKEQQRSVLRPAVLQAPPAKTFTESSEYHALTHSV